MIPKTAKGYTPPIYLRQLSSITGVPVNAVRDVLNAQLTELMLQLAAHGKADTIFGSMKLNDEKLEIVSESPYVVSLLRGEIDLDEVTSELSSSI